MKKKWLHNRYNVHVYREEKSKEKETKRVESTKRTEGEREMA